MLNIKKLLYLNFIFIFLMFIWGCEKKETGLNIYKNDTIVTTPAIFKKVLSSESGILFNNIVKEKFENYFDFFAYIYNGGGVVIGDINNDDLPDIYFTGNEVSNKLYLNQGGLKFKDITASAGVAGGDGWHNGVTMVDINHDGLLDIYVCRGGWKDTDEQRKNLLFINKGDLTFVESAHEYGLDDDGYSMQASFFDMDNDNDLDMFLTNRPDNFYLPLSELSKGRFNAPERNRDKLFRNENGKFIEVGLKSGITNNYGYTLGVVTADINKDGFIDIFVSNDYATSDYLYINQGDGTFKEQIKESMNHISLFSMGADIADINNDGLEDIMVMEMRPEDYVRSKVSMPSMDVEGFHAIVGEGMHKQYMHNMLHLNQGNLFFSEISQIAGIDKTDWSWSVIAADFNNSGFKDIFVSNGFRRDIFDGDAQQRLVEYAQKNKDKYDSPEEFFGKGFKEFIEVYKPIKVRNYLFRNEGNLKFKDVSEVWGFDETSFSHGASVADLDGDGDLDLVVNNLENEAFLFENTSSSSSLGNNHYLRVKLKGPEKNTFGLGAKVTIYIGEEIQYFENKSVRGYLSSSEPIVHFGLGSVTKIDSLKVNWNDGKVNFLKNIQSNQRLDVDYDDAVQEKETQYDKKPLFTEYTNAIFPQPFTHLENEFNEFEDQILLPHMFSRSGPFIATGDINNDNEEDFYVGGASGQAGQLFVQKNGKLIRKLVSVFEKDKQYEDMGSLFFDANQDGYLDLYVVSGGSEFPEGHSLYQDRLYLNDGKGNFIKAILPKIESSGSCVVAHDIDCDGDLDLFIGGQVVMGNYPKAPKSYFLINENGQFKNKTIEITPEIAEIGMVNSAVWADLNGDAIAELIIVGEWMPIKVFENNGGKLNDISEKLGLNNTQGWWNKVVAEDLDCDGDLDLIIGNQGENYKFKPTLKSPLHVFAKDFDRNGTNDIFLAKMNKGDLVPIRGKECTSMQMPVISQKFPSFQSFADAELQDILGTGLEDALHLESYVFSSIILENDNGNLKLKKLPIEAQFSAVNSFLIEDFDGDGQKDILVAGNKFDAEVETTPADASPGLFLKGLGNLNYESTKSFESGFFVPYNLKDMKLIKLKNDWGILASSNDDILRIFKHLRLE